MSSGSSIPWKRIAPDYAQILQKFEKNQIIESILERNSENAWIQAWKPIFHYQENLPNNSVSYARQEITTGEILEAVKALGNKAVSFDLIKDTNLISMLQQSQDKEGLGLQRSYWSLSWHLLSSSITHQGSSCFPKPRKSQYHPSLPADEAGDELFAREEGPWESLPESLPGSFLPVAEWKPAWLPSRISPTKTLIFELIFNVKVAKALCKYQEIVCVVFIDITKIFDSIDRDDTIVKLVS